MVVKLETPPAGSCLPYEGLFFEKKEKEEKKKEKKEEEREKEEEEEEEERNERELGTFKRKMDFYNCYVRFALDILHTTSQQRTKCTKSKRHHLFRPSPLLDLQETSILNFSVVQRRR